MSRDSRERRNGRPAEPSLESQYARDRDMMQLVNYFLDELQGRLILLRAAWDDGDRTRIQHLTGQIQHAARGYGYPVISASAAELESSVLAEEAELSAASERFEALVELCQRATRGRT